MDYGTYFDMLTPIILESIVPPQEMTHSLDQIDQHTQEGTERKTKIAALRLLMESRGHLHDFALAASGVKNPTLTTQKYHQIEASIALVSNRENPHLFELEFNQYLQSVRMALDILDRARDVDEKIEEVRENPFILEANVLDQGRVDIIEQTACAEEETNPLLRGLRYHLVQRLDELNTERRERITDLAHATSALVRENDEESWTYLLGISIYAAKVLAEAENSTEANLFRSTMAQYQILPVGIKGANGSHALAFFEIG